MKQLSSVCEPEESSLVLKILVASRPVPRIESEFKKCITIKLEDQTTEDIRRFVSKGTKRISDILEVDQRETRIIGQMMVERSRGVFLWVKLVLDELEDMAHDGSTLANMEAMLETLPRELDDLYARIQAKLEKPRIIRNGMAETVHMLQWVAYSSRPLSLLELIEANAVLACDTHDLSLELLDKNRARNFNQARRIILTKCGGFLEVKNDFVQFIHQTVREFLFKQPETSTLHLSEHESAVNIASTCLRYLDLLNHEMAKVFVGGEHVTNETGEFEASNYSERLQSLKSFQLRLLNYAVYHSGPPNPSLVSYRDDSVFQNLEHACSVFRQLSSSLLETAVRLDRIDDIELLLQLEVEIDDSEAQNVVTFLKNKDEHHRCFLACKGYSCIIKWLAERHDWSAGETLQGAVSEGHEDGVRCLLGCGVLGESVSNGMSKVLHMADEKRHYGIVELILRHGFEGEEDAACDALRGTVQCSSPKSLHHAASKGYETTVRLLLYLNAANIDAWNGDGRTALYLAASEGHESRVRLLLNRGANFSADGGIALSHAASKGHEVTVRLLLDCCADVMAKYHYNQRALNLAASGGHDPTVRLLLERGADINAKGHDGRMALYFAASRGHEPTVRLLLERGADINAKGDDGRTALYPAASGGDESMVRLLLEWGADINAKGDHGSTALYHAASGGHTSMVRLLLERGADINAKGGHGRKALYPAASGGHESMVQLLLEWGADINAKGHDGKTALYLAASGGHESMVRLLLERGADINAKGHDGRTALYPAASGGHESMVLLLLKQGAEINAKDDYGSSALSLAASEGHESMVRLLLEQGADINAKSHDGRTALYHAASGGHESTVWLLLARGADINAKGNDSRTALDLAASGGHESTVRLLLARGADINAKSNDSRTALDLAASGGHGPTVRLLLDLGADHKAKNKNGLTALDYAVLGRHADTIQLLCNYSTAD